MLRIICLFAIATITALGADVAGLLTAARSAQRSNDLTTAEDYFNAAFELALEKDHKHISPVAVEVSTFFSQRQLPDKAEAVLKRAFDAEENASEPPSAEVPVLMRLQSLYQNRRRYVDLVPVEQRLVTAWENLAGPESAVVGNNLYHLAGTLEQAQYLNEAEKAIERAVAIFEKVYAADSPPVGTALSRLGSIEKRLGKTDAAADAQKRSAAMLPKPATPNAVTTGNGISPPRLISKQEPKYSEKARKKKIQGTVMLTLVVDPQGEPKDIKVILPLGDGLDENAIEAVSTWRFHPGLKGNEPVAVKATIEVNFRLL